LHLLGQERLEQRHDRIEYGPGVVVIERFKPSRHTILQLQHVKTVFTVYEIMFTSFRLYDFDRLQYPVSSIQYVY